MEFVYKILFVLVLVAVFGIVAHIIDKVSKRGKNIDKAGKISFRETMDLVELPIITFKVGENKYNFLLDTGASLCIVDSNVLDTMNHQQLEGEGTVYGIGGKETEVTYVRVALKYKEVEYADTFQVLDLSTTFGALKEEHGVNLHGVLGNSFFQKYKYVIDFDELVAYSTT